MNEVGRGKKKIQRKMESKGALTPLWKTPLPSRNLLSYSEPVTAVLLTARVDFRSRRLDSSCRKKHEPRLPGDRRERTS